MEAGGPSSPDARRGDRPIAEAFVDRLQARLAERYGTRAFRLRFDRVALRFIAQLQDELHDAIPDGATLLVTVTAPLRQASKTAKELIETLHPLCARKSARRELEGYVHGNAVAARIVRGVTGSETVVVLVHNPDPNAGALIDEAARMLTIG